MSVPNLLMRARPRCTAFNQAPAALSEAARPMGREIAATPRLEQPGPPRRRPGPLRLPHSCKLRGGKHFRSTRDLAHTRKIAPIFFPRITLAPMIVAARKTMAHTPRALANSLPVPMSWNSSKIVFVIG